MRGQQAVVTHAENLIGQRQRHCGGKNLPPAVGYEQHESHQAAIQGELWAHQPRQPGPEGEPIGFAITPGVAARARPPQQQPPQHRKVEDAQAPFQAGGKEVAGRWQGHIHKCAGRKDGSRAHACRRPRTDNHCCYRQEEAQINGDAFQICMGNPAHEEDEVLPQRGGIGLYTLAHIEHGPVSGFEVTHGAQDNEAVIGNPTACEAAPER